MELICTIAIFSIVITGVGSAMVISARSYRNGNVELDLQQQAQITSNLLTNLIIDADRVVSASGSALTVEKVESGVTVTYTVYLDGDQIVYQKDGSTPQTLAEHVTGFAVNNAAGNDNVDFTLQFAEGGRTYESDYHVTPRNGVTAGGASMSGTAGIYVENKLILEPGQTYDLNVRITGTSIQGFSIQNLTGSTDTTGTTVAVVDTRTAHITVGAGETGTGSNASFRFQVVADDGSAAPQDVEVLVRRVNAVSVNGYRTSGSVNKAGAVYKVMANLAGTNLEKEPGAWYDVDYVNPYTAEWTFAYNGVDDSGSAVNFGDYFEVTGSGVEGNIPYVIIRSKRDLAKTPKLVVTCTALHPEGACTSAVASGASTGDITNKTGMKYDTVTGIWELEYSAWKRNGKIDIALSHLEYETDPWNGTKYYPYQGTANVTYQAYDKYGNMLDTSWPTGASYNPYTSSSNGSLDAEVDRTGAGGADILTTWALILNPTTYSGQKMPYSTPYIGINITENPANGYGNRFNYGWMTNWAAASYKVQVSYDYENDEGVVVRDTIEGDYPVEDVTIQYRSSVYDNWRRNNVVYVTDADLVSEYRVYFRFDHGWEGEDYYFNDLDRFVGFIENNTGYKNDVRCDIPVSGYTEAGQYTGGNSYLTFTLDAATRQKCKEALARAVTPTDRIEMIYEYNPFFGKLNMRTISWDEDKKMDLSNYEELDSASLPGGLTIDQMDAIKGCEGYVTFCFKDPNITGTTVPKVMYCPTVAEYGTVYYIDDTARFLISDTTAQYQEQSGGVWSTTVNLTWNDTGWTAN